MVCSVFHLIFFQRQTPGDHTTTQAPLNSTKPHHFRCTVVYNIKLFTHRKKKRKKKKVTEKPSFAILLPMALREWTEFTTKRKIWSFISF